MARKHHDPVPPLEWAAAAVGLLVALVLLGIVAREAFATRDDSVPVLTASVERVTATAAGHVVEVRVDNASNQAAATVQIEGTIGEGVDEETSSATVDYVPGRSNAKAGLIFSRDPRQGAFELRVTGYEIP